MRKIATLIYAGSIVLCLFIFMHGLLFFAVDVTSKNPDEGFGYLTGYVYNVKEDASAPLGVQENYSFTLTRVDGSYRELVFFTIHQNVDVYVGNERVYHMSPAKQNAVGRTPGCVWNKVRFNTEDENRIVRVVIQPVYKSSRNVTPVFYYGNLHDIGMRICMAGLPIILLCLIGIGAGVVYVMYTLYNYRNSELDKTLMLLGCFALAVSLWKLTDSSTFKFLFNGMPVLYMVPFLTLQLMSIPFILFIKEMLSSRESKIWYIPIGYTTIVLLLTLGMQYFRIRDMRQNLLLIHGGLVLTVLVTICMVVYEIFVVGWNEKLKRNVIFLCICFVGMGLDMGIYYLTKGTKTTPLGMLGLVVYIFASGAFTLRDSRELMRIGMEARNYERKAYHDHLTGLFNRAAYAEYVDGEGFSPDQCILAVFDLNNLKKCNDTLGHEKGDVYIKECASMINKAFGDIGKCYRMGGDEFSVLMENVSMNVCKQRMESLQGMVEERNRQNPEIHMGIAAGYERFDKRIDYDINDTAQRADKKMYAEKAAMKQREQNA